jgi:hypothetical protein
MNIRHTVAALVVLALNSWVRHLVVCRLEASSKTSQWRTGSRTSPASP